MTVVVVLFNLKAGAEVDAYEQWARSTDIPTVNGLGSVRRFSVLRSSALLGGGPAPYQYVELLELHSLDGLRADVTSETMRRVSQEFRAFADAPVFIVTESLE